MPKLVKTELSPAEKLCIDEYVRTRNASASFQLAFPNKYPDNKDASRRMQQLLNKPLANEYKKSVEEQIEVQTGISKEWVLQKTVQLMETAESNMDYSSAVKCLFLLSKINGYMSKQVIDVKKTISISFGGNFNPELAPGTDANLLHDENIQNVSFEEIDKIDVEDEERDNSKIDDY